MSFYWTFSQIFTVNLVSSHVFVLEIRIGSAFESISTTFGDSIDSGTDEVCLTYVKRSYIYLKFFDSIQ